MEQQPVNRPQFDALVLAETGLRRLGLAERITQVLPCDVMLPAVGQGALGVVCAADRPDACAAVAAVLDHPPTRPLDRSDPAWRRERASLQTLTDLSRFLLAVTAGSLVMATPM